MTTEFDRYYADLLHCLSQMLDPRSGSSVGRALYLPRQGGPAQRNSHSPWVVHQLDSLRHKLKAAVRGVEDPRCRKLIARLWAQAGGGWTTDPQVDDLLVNAVPDLGSAPAHTCRLLIHLGSIIGSRIGQWVPTAPGCRFFVGQSFRSPAGRRLINDLRARRGLEFVACDLRHADLRPLAADGGGGGGCIHSLELTDARWATLRGLDLREGCLKNADLRGADLRGADLRETDLRGADLRGALLDDTCLDPLGLEILDPPSVDQYFERLTPESGARYIGYRTTELGSTAPILGHEGPMPLKVGQTLVAEVFSHCRISDCHPGLYLWPSLDESRSWSARTTGELPRRQRVARVAFDPRDLVRAGRKWRVRALQVLEIIEPPPEDE